MEPVLSQSCKTSMMAYYQFSLRCVIADNESVVKIILSSVESALTRILIRVIHISTSD